jgi:NAD(P)H-quinone oxidoreductase subunit 5
MIINSLVVCVIAAPAILLAVLGIMPLISRPLGEVAVSRWTAACVVAGLLSMLGVLAMMLLGGSRSIPVELGDWVAIPSEHFHFRVKFVFDRLSVPFAILTFVLTGATATFAGRYLHREPGFGRFFLSFAIFLLGMIAASLAGTIETLFLGWELVGLSSALLVAFFHERSSPVLNAERIWTVYRISDAAFLLAAIALHRVSGAGDFTGLMGTGPWPEGEAALTSQQASWVGLLLLIAAAGKSALIPFSGWLPRAMEGPTPSSAVFYGALSVHLGTFLLLRVSPILNLSAWLGVAVVALGLSTAILATIAGRVQADAKGALAYASLTQVGIITAEIGMGLRYLPLIHIIGHACLRTLQLLRAPSLLRDYHGLENAVGGRLDRGDGASRRWLPERFYLGVYLAGFQRGQLDESLDRLIVRPFVGCFRLCDRLERRWADFLSGTPSRESERPAAAAAPREET